MTVERYTQPFWEGLENGEFRINRCRNCDEAYFPPAPLCPHCGDRDTTWETVSGRGTLYAFTRQYAVPPGFESPVVLGTVELQEGPHLLAPIDASYEALTIGMTIQMETVPYETDYDRADLAEWPFFAAIPVREP